MDGSLPSFAYWHSDDHSLLAPFLKEWRTAFPDLHIIGDADIEPILHKIRPEYSTLYNRIRFPTIKSDIARLAFIHEFGGLYVDCHCGLRSASGVLDLFCKLDEFELVLWNQSFISRPRPKNVMKPLAGILLARPRSSIIQQILLSGLANLAIDARSSASEGRIVSRPWDLCGAGNYRRILISPDSGDTQLRPEFIGRIFLSGVDDGPISIYQHNAYRADPEQHWSKRSLREPLFEPE